MKIVGINSFSSLNQKNSAFRGLEGSVDVKQIYYDLDHDSYTRKTPYFPFKNETQQEIDTYVKKNTYIDEFTAIIDYESGESMERTNYYSVEVKDTLPFDNVLWNAYKKNKYKLNEADKAFVENSLKEFNLERYIKKNPIKYIIAKLAK